MCSPFRYFNSSPEVVRLAVMMYIRYPLSLRQVEDLLFERGIGTAAQRPPQYHSPLTISTVNLEHRLCQIKTDCCNIHRGRSLCLEFKPNSILAHSTPKRGRPYHQSKLA